MKNLKAIAIAERFVGFAELLQKELLDDEPNMLYIKSVVDKMWLEFSSEVEFLKREDEIVSHSWGNWGHWA